MVDYELTGEGIMKEKEQWTKWIPLFVFAVVLVVIYRILENVGPIANAISNFISILSPFFIGILIVYFLYIPCVKVEKLYKKSKTKFIADRARLFSVLSVYLILVVILIFVFAVMIPILIDSLLDLANNMPLYFNHIVNYFDSAPEHSLWYGFDIVEFTNTTIHDFFDPSRIEQFTRSIFVFARGLFNVVISLFVSLYMLLERDKIKEFFLRVSKIIFQEKTEKRVFSYIHQINKVIFTFISSKGLNSIINFLATTLILLIFDINYAVLLGVIAGILNFIPYIGSLIGVIIITLINILTGGLARALQVLVLLIIYQQLDGNIIEPKIMGTSLKISPILVIVSVIIGGAFFGVIGMFLAVPVATIIKQVLLEYITAAEKKPKKVKVKIKKESVEK